MKEAVEYEVAILPSMPAVVSSPDSTSVATKTSRGGPKTFYFKVELKSVPDFTWEDELKEYLTDPELDFKKMWTSRKRKNYRLKEVSQRIFSIPATSASGERVFSKSGLLMSPLRSSTHELTLEMLTFLRSNQALIEDPKAPLKLAKIKVH